MDQNAEEIIDEKVVPGTILDCHDLIDQARASLSHRYSINCTPPSLVEVIFKIRISIFPQLKSLSNLDFSYTFISMGHFDIQRCSN